MQQLFFVRKNMLQWREVAEPTIQHKQAALVRPFAVAKCDLDDAFLFHNMPALLSIGNFLGLTDPDFFSQFGKNFFKGPFPFGHECVAEVIETGEDVHSLKPGDVVSVPFQISCGSCANCKNGNTAFCSKEDSISTYGFGKHLQFGGAMSDKLVVPYADAMLVKIPSHINPVHLASMGDNVSDAYRHIGPHLTDPGNQSVIVIGGAAKSVGLYSVLLAKAMGVAQIDYVDKNEERRQHAKQLGADTVITSFENIHQKYDLAVEASSDGNGLKAAIKSLKPYGICSSSGIYLKKIKLPMIYMYANGIYYKNGLTNARSEMEKILELVKNGKLDLSKVTTKLDRWDNAIEAFLSRSSKVIVTRERIFS